jgi:HlyD family secretion protein
MKAKRVVIAVVIVLGAVAALFFWNGRGRRNGTPPGTLQGNGTVETVEIEVSATYPGRLVELGPREGDRVVRGATVARLDGGDIEGQVATARGALAASRASLAELAAGSRDEEIRRLEATLEAARMQREQAVARRDRVRAGARIEQVEQMAALARQADVALVDAERELARFERLLAAGAVPGREVDQARTRRDAAAAARDAAGQRLAEARAGSRPEEIREAETAVAAAEAQVASARAALDLGRAGARSESLDAARARVEQAAGSLQTAENRLSQTVITAPIDGLVTQRNAEPGEVVTAGFPLLRLADLASVWLKVYIPETELGRVKLGQAAEVTADTWPGKVYRGRVTEIADTPEFTPKNVQTREERVKLVYAVKVAVDNPAFELKPGMPADARIRVAE